MTGSSTVPVLDPQTGKRLILIRLLYQQGVDQSRLPDPLIFTSVLSFHDAVELFLVLTGEHLNAPLPPSIGFMSYWTELHPTKLQGGVDLSGKVAMDRLNRMRVGFKHRGLVPGLAAIEQARADVANFFEDNTPKVFGVAFNDIDMADVIPQAPIREKVRKASATSAAGDRTEAMVLLAEVFDSMFAEHVKGRSFVATPFSFGRNIRWPLHQDSIRQVLKQPDTRSRSMPVRGPENLAEQIAVVTEIAEATQGALRIIALGLDYRQYHRFRQLTPKVYQTVDSEMHRSYATGYSPSTEEFDYCQQFVISVALRLADLQAHTAPPSWEAGNSDP